MTSRDEDGRLPSLQASCLATVAAALDEIGAKWMITGAAAHALLDVAPWPDGGLLTLTTDKFPPSRLAPSVGHLDEASFERTTQSNGLRIAPPEYLPIHSARQSNKALASAISERFKIDWAFVDEAVARDPRDPPVACVMRQVRNGSASV